MGRTLRRSKSFRDKGLRHWNWGSNTCKMFSHYQLYQLALLCNKPFQSLVASNNNHLLFLMILWAALVILLIWVYSADHCWALSCVWSASDLAGAGSPWIASGTWLTLGSLLSGTLHSSSTWSLFLPVGRFRLFHTLVSGFQAQQEREIPKAQVFFKLLFVSQWLWPRTDSEVEK